MSKQYRRSPAELYFISDEVTAWCFNRAVMTFGMSLDNALETASAKSKTDRGAKRARQNVMNKWMTMPGESTAGRFADPAAMTGKKASASQPAESRERPDFMRDDG